MRCSSRLVRPQIVRLVAYVLIGLPATRIPGSRCLGYRPYDPAKKTFGPYEWMNYQTVQRRRAEFGVGLVELHKQIGVLDAAHGVGLWCQNRPEWQITGMWECFDFGPFQNHSGIINTL